MKAIVKRLLKVLTFLLMVPLHFAWLVIWAGLSVIVWVVAGLVYIAIGKDISDWWVNTLNVVISAYCKINDKIDLL